MSLVEVEEMQVICDNCGVEWDRHRDWFTFDSIGGMIEFFWPGKLWDYSLKQTRFDFCGLECFKFFLKKQERLLDQQGEKISRELEEKRKIERKKI